MSDAASSPALIEVDHLSVTQPAAGEIGRAHV